MFFNIFIHSISKNKNTFNKNDETYTEKIFKVKG